MKTQLPFLCAALILLPSIALAAPASNANRNDEGAIVTDHGSFQELKFDEADNVDGEVMLPNGVNVGGRRAADHANMIGIRGQFIAQLSRLSNDI
jgi:hypothetical protein